MEEFAAVFADLEDPRMGKAKRHELLEILLGSVTGTGASLRRLKCLVKLGRSGRPLPGLHRLGPEGPKCTAGEEMTLMVERVVDRSLHRERTLG